MTIGFASDGERQHAMVMERMEGSLAALLSSKAPLPWQPTRWRLATDVASGMAYLHGQSPPVLHRDLKPENVLVDDGWQSKIADFGCSREADLDKTMEMAGTPLFMAPELLRRERYDEKVDVWSFACVLECLWTHKQVYEALLEARYTRLLRSHRGGT